MFQGEPWEDFGPALVCFSELSDALSVLALAVSAGEDHIHVENTEPCLQWKNISGAPIVWLPAQCLYPKVTVKSGYYLFFS